MSRLGAQTWIQFPRTWKHSFFLWLSGNHHYHHHHNHHHHHHHHHHQHPDSSNPPSLHYLVHSLFALPQEFSRQPNFIISSYFSRTLPSVSKLSAGETYALSSGLLADLALLNATNESAEISLSQTRSRCHSLRVMLLHHSNTCSWWAITLLNADIRFWLRTYGSDLGDNREWDMGACFSLTSPTLCTSDKLFSMCSGCLTVWSLLFFPPAWALGLSSVHGALSFSEIQDSSNLQIIILKLFSKTQMIFF